MKTVFPVGRPVDAADVVDREEFIEETRLRLMEGHSVMMAGPRRIGKSSVARAVLARLREAGCYTAQVDLFYVTSLEEFASKLMESVLENRVGVITRTARAVKGFRRLFSNGEVRAKIHDLELGVTWRDEGAEPLELLDSAVMVAEKLAERDGRRMVVLLDEFQEVERLGGQDLLKRLRSLFQQQTHTAYLFLGSHPTLMRTIFADRRQAFYRFATLVDLPPIPETAWQAYLSRRFAESGRSLTGPGFRLLMERTGGHPYCVMAVAYNAHVHAEMYGVGDITADVIDFAVEQSLAQLQPVYDAQWQELRRHKHADAVLAALLEGRPPYSLPLSRGVVGRALQELVDLSIVERGSRRGEYRLVEPMFGEWFRRTRA